jgi:hypothetical protein
MLDLYIEPDSRSSVDSLQKLDLSIQKLDLPVLQSQHQHKASRHKWDLNQSEMFSPLKRSLNSSRKISNSSGHNSGSNSNGHHGHNSGHTNVHIGQSRGTSNDREIVKVKLFTNLKLPNIKEREMQPMPIKVYKKKFMVKRREHF